MKACMVVYGFYETDTRVIRYAEALVERGDEVDVFALRGHEKPKKEMYRGVNLYRITKCDVKVSKRFIYLINLLLFLIKSCFYITVKHLRSPYSLIHVHSVPDFEVFAAVFVKLMGAKVILDIHDIVPEFYASKFNVSHESIIFKLLVLTERISCAFSDHVIISNHIWEKKLLARSVHEGKCTTMLNYVDLSVFHRRPRKRKDDRFIIIYPGSVNWHQGLDIAIEALAMIADRFPKVELHIYADGGDNRRYLEALAERLHLRERVIFRNSLPIEEIATVMADADIGIVPKRDDPFGGEAFSTKIFEFMATGIPVVVASTRIDLYYFNDRVVKFFKAGSAEDLAMKIVELIEHPEERETFAENGLAFVKGYAWDERKHDYLNLVDSLVKKRS
ncbi:MAG: glycosyltransferase family 4 protein [Syntrophorhabdaceae bacterium]|nr:glycosyltransferase family 4 protein [Syntrophorhabdaceae bacterium]